MNNKEWEKLKSEYEKESNRRWEIKNAKRSAKELKEKINYIVDHKGTIREINIDIPGSDWQHDKTNLCLKDDWKLVELFIDCLETFIPTLDNIMNIDEETGEVKR